MDNRYRNRRAWSVGRPPVLLVPEPEEDPWLAGRPLVLVPEAEADPWSAGTPLVLVPEAEEDPLWSTEWLEVSAVASCWA
jgi:hypothetical protein